MSSTIFIGLRVQIATAAARYAIPVMYSDQQMVEAGGLISYGTDAVDDWGIVGTYVGRILKGEKAADLPVQQPSSFQLAVNLGASTSAMGVLNGGRAKPAARPGMRFQCRSRGSFRWRSTGTMTTHTHFTDNIVRAGLNYQFH